MLCVDEKPFVWVESADETLAAYRQRITHQRRRAGGNRRPAAFLSERNLVKGRDPAFGRPAAKPDACIGLGSV